MKFILLVWSCSLASLDPFSQHPPLSNTEKCQEANLMLNQANPAAQRLVTCSTKDSQGNILALGGSWGKVTRDEAIRQIEEQTYYYYVTQDSGTMVPIIVVETLEGKLILTCSDDSTTDTLRYLPDCSK